VERSFLGRLLWLLSESDGRNRDLLINDSVIILQRHRRRSVVKLQKRRNVECLGMFMEIKAISGAFQRQS
jgi:hypothetical protein